MRLSIITRTADRLRFLERASQGIAAAALAESEWIVCDDARSGTPELEAFIAHAAASLPLQVRLVRSCSGSRSKAANAGLAAAKGEFVHIHDDDDTIDAAFYRRSIDFLEQHNEYGGVASLADRIDERLEADRIVALSRRPHYREMRSVTLSSMAVTQTIPPIAFVARRSVMAEVGTFDERLDVCEDHEYFLRFLLTSDIGRIPEVLAAFHVRLSESAGSSANSPASTDHAATDARFRNFMLRNDLAVGRIGLGWLLAAGEMNRANWRANYLIEKLRRRPTLAGINRSMRRWIVG